MYRVTIYNGTTSTVIHEPSTDPDDAHLYECSLVQGSSGEIDSLSFTITPNNPGYEKLNSYSTFIEVVDLRSKGEAAIFSGRVLSVSPQMEESGLVYKNIVCEDRLGYLCDSIQPYTTMNTYTVREFLELLLNNHNAQVEDYKKMYVGTVSFNTSSGNVTKSLNYQTTWEAITGKLLELGGEIQLYTLNGLLYIDYVTELGTMGDQTIEIAKNMRSLEQDKSPTDIITRLIPLGDYLEEQTGESDDRERLTIASVNGGRTYIDDSDAIAAYGIIAGTVIWEDVTLASNLLEKGQQWLKDQSVNETVSLSAYDLYAAGIDPDVIERYNYYLTYNPLIGVNKWYRVAQKTINVIDPTDVSFTMGDQSTSLSSTVKRTGQDAADAAAAINANLSKTVATLIAGNAIIQYLQAEVAEIETLYVTKEYVEELVAADIQATIIEAGLLTADSAVITDLTAFAANIYTLLGGEGAFGELQTAHLTADNVVIDEAVIVNAIAGTILADMIEADYIDTDLISIHSEDGTLWIDGSTILIYDANGNPRIQIGLDELGDYNLALWDADGNCMWNATGATEYGINDGVVRDSMVADDANISGYKLNIEEICSIINSSGQYEIDASSVTISGTTLDAWYATITEEIEGLEGLSFEGLISIEPWFALSSSDTEPPEEGEPSAIIGTFVCGTMPCGHRGATDWVDYDIQTEEGMYKWVKWKGTYADGHTEWSIPYCLTDGYLRTTTGVLQTELEVVQGWISARVWYTEIMDDVDTLIETDVWSELNIWLNGIELEVGEMQSTFTEQYESLAVQVAGIYIDVNSITSRVESSEQQIASLEYAIENLDLEGVSYFETYFCLGDSATEAPDGDWTLTDPQAGEGEYKWVRYLLYYEDGHTEWTTPYCLTEQYERTQISEIVQTATSITERVSSVETWLGDDFTSFTGFDTCISQYIENSRAEIMLDVSSNYATNSYVDEVLAGLDLEGVTDIDTYYCVWYSDVDAPPDDVGDPAICGEATCGNAICGLTDGVMWYQDLTVEGTFSYSGTIAAGATERISIPAAPDNYKATKIISFSCNLDASEPYIDGDVIRVTVTNNTSSSATVDLSGTVECEPSGGNGIYIWARLLLTYIDGHVVWTDPWCTSTDTSEFATIAYTDAQIKLSADETSASIMLRAEAMFVTGDEWSVSVAEIYTYVDAEVASISLTVEGSLGDRAAIIVQAGGHTSTQYLDLSLVREVFAAEDSSVTITAGLIQFGAGRLVIESEHFRLDKDQNLYIDTNQFVLDYDGNATFSGNLSAPSGDIGGWSIRTTGLTSNYASVTPSSLTYGDNFSVDSGGHCIAKQFDAVNNVRLWSNGYQVAGEYIELEPRQDRGGWVAFGDYSSNGTSTLIGALTRYKDSSLSFGCDGINLFCYGSSSSDPSFVAIGDYSEWRYIMNAGMNPWGYSQRHIFRGDAVFTRYSSSEAGNVTIEGTLTVGDSTVATQDWVTSQLSGSGSSTGGYATKQDLSAYVQSANLDSEVSALGYIKSGSSGDFVTQQDLNNTLNNYVLQNAQVSYSISNGTTTVTGSCRPFSTGLVLNLADLFDGSIGGDITCDSITVTADPSWIGIKSDGTNVGLFAGTSGDGAGSVTHFICYWSSSDRYYHVGNGTTDDAGGLKIHGTDIIIGASGTTTTIYGYNSGSDARLKTSIQPLNTSALDNLTPVSFKWRDGDDRTHYGYIAQEVQPYFPELVSEGTDGMLGLAYTEIIPLLHLEIKQLKARITQLERGN